MWTVGTWPAADRVVVSGDGWRLAALGTVTATPDELQRAGAHYDRTSDPAALSELPGCAHLMWRDTATDLGDVIVVGVGESPIFYTERPEGWYAASAAAPLARVVAGAANRLAGVHSARRGHAVLLTAIGTAEAQ